MKTENNTTQKVLLKDLLDIPAFQKMSESFTQLTGLGTAILDINGDVLSASGWQQICTEFHRKHPDTASRCLESDTVLAGQLERGEKYNIYKCKNGLVDVAVPIIIENIHVGNLFTGQFFFEPPDRDFFIQQAEKYGFDNESYLESLAKVPVFSMDKVERAMNFLAELTVIVGNSGYDRKKLLEVNENLEQRVEERTTELMDSNERFRSLSEAAFEGIVISENGVIIDINDTCCNMVGYQPSELINTEATALIPLDLRDGVKQKILSGFEGAYESKCLRKDGAIFPIEVQAKMFLHNGKNARVTAVRDITERKRNERQIEIEKHFSESLINSLPSTMYVFDQLGRLKRWNKNLESVTGYTSDQIKNMNPLDFIVLKDKTRVKEIIEKFFIEGSASIEADFLTMSGEAIPYLLTGYKFVQNDLNYIVGIGVDIRDRVKSEKEKETLIEKLQATLVQVKQLSGFLPICASCKKIRDDKGYWNQIESYVRDHSEAEFSHSVCPDCFEKLYPGLADRVGE